MDGGLGLMEALQPTTSLEVLKGIPSDLVDASILHAEGCNALAVVVLERMDCL